MADKIKVLHVVHGFGAGGAETWLLAAARYLKTNPQVNLHFDFLATSGTASVYDEEIQSQGCKVFYIRYSFKRMLQFRKKVKRILQQECYDVIHDHQDFVSGWHFFSLIGSLPSVRIAHLHNPFNFVRNYINGFSRLVSYKLGRLLMFFLSTSITGTSDAVMNEYGYNKKPYNKKRVKPAYCGIDTDYFRFQSSAKSKLCQHFGWETNNTNIALFVGRVAKRPEDTALNQKNPAFAFDIAKKMAGTDKSWKFFFVGDKGEPGNVLETKTKELGLEHNIIFTGVRKDISFLMSAADLMIFPSLWEGLGMVAVEAQASGLPVIISDTVPSEAIVVDELVFCCPITSSEVWVEKIHSVLAASFKKREDYATVVASSPFAIEHSVSRLISLYR